MSRPKIICHMASSLDGRLLTRRWPIREDALMALYEATADRLDADGWIVGRRTMEEDIPVGPPALASAPSSRPDRYCGGAGQRVIICFDRSGRLQPETGDLEGDHLVLVVSNRVSDARVQDLAARGVSVVFSGPEGDRIGDAIERIAEAFNLRRLLLEGGGEINAAFLAAHLIDETSTLVFPVIDGQRDVPAIYHGATPEPARRLELISAESLEEGIVWLRHRMRFE